jgi:alpha-L-fucosidase
MSQQPPEPRNLDREARLAWWHEAKFGMFIHWGLYALPAGEWKGKACSGIGEWIMFKARIPIAEYEQLAQQFNPVKFDAEAWAQLAQDAGMRYLVITAKHHDGFAMFGSKADAFNIVDATPFKRDPVKELAAACAKRGIRFGCYYSQAQDWHAPGGAIWGTSHEGAPVREKPQWDPRQAGDFDEYLDRKAIPQVREILTRYGPIAIIWFDTPLKVMTVERAARLEKVVHELQPACLVSGRLGGKSQSDYDSEGDNKIPNLSRHVGLQEGRPQLEEARRPDVQTRGHRQQGRQLPAERRPRRRRRHPAAESGHAPRRRPLAEGQRRGDLRCRPQSVRQ